MSQLKSYRAITDFGLTGLAFLAGKVIKIRNFCKSPNFESANSGQVRVETVVRERFTGYYISPILRSTRHTPEPVVPTIKLPSGSIAIDRKPLRDRKSTRLNSSHVAISYAVFCLKKKN